MKELRAPGFSFRFLISAEGAVAIYFLPFVYGGSWTDTAIISLRQVFFAIAVILLIYDFLRGEFRLSREIVAAIFIYLLFIAYINLSYTWSPGYSYPGDKIQSIWMFCLPSFFLAIYAFRSVESTRRFVNAVAFMGPILLIRIVTVINAESLTDIHTLFEEIGGYQGLSINLAFPLLSYVIIMSDFETRNNWPRIVAFLLFVSTFGVISVIGGLSGILIFLSGGFCLVMVLIDRSKSDKPVWERNQALYIILAVCLIGFIIYAFSLDEMPRAFRRLLDKFNDEGFGTTTGRMKLMAIALDVWDKFIVFGAGVGGYPVIAGFGDVNQHPHNVVLEILAETGIVGIILFTLVLGFSYRHFFKQRAGNFDLYRAFGLAFAVGTLALSQTTADLGTYWMHAGLGSLLIAPATHLGDQHKMREQSLPIGAAG